MGKLWMWNILLMHVYSNNKTKLNKVKNAMFWKVGIHYSLSPYSSIGNCLANMFSGPMLHGNIRLSGWYNHDPLYRVRDVGHGCFICSSSIHSHFPPYTCSTIRNASSNLPSAKNISMNWLLRQAVITMPTWISLDKLCIDIPVLTCEKHVLICLTKNIDQLPY